MSAEFEGGSSGSVAVESSAPGSAIGEASSQLDGWDGPQSIPEPSNQISFNTPIVSEINNPFGPEISEPSISDKIGDTSLLISDEFRSVPVDLQPVPWGDITIERLQSVDSVSVPIQEITDGIFETKSITEISLTESLRNDIDRILNENPQPIKESQNLNIPEIYHEVLEETARQILENEDLGNNFEAKPQTEEQIESSKSLAIKTAIAPSGRRQNHEPMWDIFNVTSKLEIAREVLKRRTKEAVAIVEDAFKRKDKKPRLAIADELDRIDKPDAKDKKKIEDMELIFPLLKDNAKTAVDIADDKHKETLQGVLEDIVKNTPPEEVLRESRYIKTVRQSELDPKEAKTLADNGATGIIYENGVWRATGKRPQKFPTEMEEAA